MYKLGLEKAEEIVFSPLYILASFVKDKVSIGAWIYLWAFYLVPLIYISVFVPAQYCLDDCGFVVEPEIRQVDSSSSILLSQDCFGYSSLLCSHTNCEINCSSSVKNTVGSLIGGEGNGTPLQYSCLENPWMEEPDRLQSMGSLRVGHD